MPPQSETTPPDEEAAPTVGGLLRLIRYMVNTLEAAPQTLIALFSRRLCSYRQLAGLPSIIEAHPCGDTGTMIAFRIKHDPTTNARMTKPFLCEDPRLFAVMLLMGLAGCHFEIRADRKKELGRKLNYYPRLRHPSKRGAGKRVHFIRAVSGAEAGVVTSFAGDYHLIALRNLEPGRRSSRQSKLGREEAIELATEVYEETDAESRVGLSPAAFRELLASLF